MDRESDIYQEAAALWREVFGEPAPPHADGEALLDAIVTRSSPPASYDRLNSPHLRPTTITRPADPGHGR